MSESRIQLSYAEIFQKFNYVKSIVQFFILSESIPSYEPRLELTYLDTRALSDAGVWIERRDHLMSSLSPDVATWHIHSALCYICKSVKKQFFSFDPVSQHIGWNKSRPTSRHYKAIYFLSLVLYSILD